MIRRRRREGLILLSFSLFYGLIVGKYALICAMEIQKIHMVVHIFSSLRSRRLEVVGTRKNGRARRRHARGEEAPARKAPENRFPPPL